MKGFHIPWGIVNVMYHDFIVVRKLVKLVRNYGNVQHFVVLVTLGVFTIMFAMKTSKLLNYI